MSGHDNSHAYTTIVKEARACDGPGKRDAKILEAGDQVAGCLRSEENVVPYIVLGPAQRGGQSGRATATGMNDGPSWPLGS